MVGYYERRKSRAAIWCWRFAAVSVPFLILTVLLHRSASITTPQAFWLIAFAIALLLGSLLFGMRAAADLWERGYKGGRATVNGIVLAVILLIPFGIQLVKAIEHPQLNDVSTDVLNPPVLLEPVNNVAVADAETVYDEFTARRIVGNYPELVARRYSAPPERVAGAVMELLNSWNWRVTASRNLPASQLRSEEGSGDNEALSTDGDALAGDQAELEDLQIGNAAEGGIPDIVVQAKAQSLVMKLPSHLVIRLIASGNSTLVDMRSFSVWGRHDFGSNADNITAFLQALDESLAGVAGES